MRRTIDGKWRQSIVFKWFTTRCSTKYKVRFEYDLMVCKILYKKKSLSCVMSHLGLISEHDSNFSLNWKMIWEVQKIGKKESERSETENMCVLKTNN